jgi:hypothetical protein
MLCGGCCADEGEVKEKDKMVHVSNIWEKGGERAEEVIPPTIYDSPQTKPSEQEKKQAPEKPKEPEKPVAVEPEQVPEPKVKPQCKDFRIKVTRAQNAPLGIMLDCLDEHVGQLTATKEGTLQDYNKTALYEQQLLIGDFIIEVNGKSGDGAVVLTELQGSTNIDMLVRRGQPFRVDVRASPGAGVGQSLSNTLGQALSGITLLVQEVHELFVQWNKDNPQMPVMKNDRVVEVNGLRGNLSVMRDEIQKSNEFSFLIQSPFS